MKSFSYIILFFLFVIEGCSSHDSNVENIIQKMKSCPVNTNFDQMSCWLNDSMQKNRPWEKAKMKLVVYADSTSCTECTLKKLYLWEDFVQLEKKYNNQFYIFFIFNPRKGTNVYDMTSYIKVSELNHPIYIDSKGVLGKSNSHLRLFDARFQIFLLDEFDNVKFVGNPLFNFDLEEKLIRCLNEKLSIDNSVV